MIDSSYVTIDTLRIQQDFVIETQSVKEKVMRPQPAPPPYRFSTASRHGWEMALAAGGTIQQITKLDQYPELWDWEASELISIRLLNTVIFESVTGLAAPPSPISLTEYSKAGIPSMSFYIIDDSNPLSATGKSLMIETIGEIDSTKAVELGVRLSPKGRLICCIVCERSLCDSV
jgi:hypothetical protein